MGQSREPRYLEHALPVVERTIEYLSGPDGRWVRHGELIRVLQTNSDVAALLVERAGEDEAGKSVEWFAANLVAWLSHYWTAGRRRADALERDRISGGYVYRAKRGVRPALPRGVEATARLAPPAYSRALDRAMQFAAVVHGQQTLEGTAVPYIVHPVQVGRLLEQHWYPERVVLAGVLHDALHIPDYSSPALQGTLATAFDEFGDLPAGVAAAVVLPRAKRFVSSIEEDAACPGLLELVLQVAEATRDEAREELAWNARKRAQLEALSTAHRDVLAVRAADLLHSVRFLTQEVRERGASALLHVAVGTGAMLWYFAMASATIAERLGETHRFVHELVEAVFDFEATLISTGLLPGRGAVPWAASAPTPNVDIDSAGFDVFGEHDRRIHARGHWFHAAPPAKGLAHWKDGRSAKELARAWTRGPLHTTQVPSELASLLEVPEVLRGFRCATVHVERQTPLPDGQRGPRHHDLVAYGMAGGLRLVICVEAKADEPFGPLIKDVFAEHDAASTPGTTTRPMTTGRRARAEVLTRLVFGRDVDEEIKGLRYQLLHAVAGTVEEARASEAPRACFVVHEFVGAATTPDRVKANGSDLDAFAHALGLPRDQSVAAGGMCGPFAMRAVDGSAVELWIGKCRTNVAC
jgi:hypothetical protein